MSARLAVQHRRLDVRGAGQLFQMQLNQGALQRYDRGPDEVLKKRPEQARLISNMNPPLSSHP
jgi:hypothetical protein